MFNKKLHTFILISVLLFGICTVNFAVSDANAEEPRESFGNLSSALLAGGYAADYADGMILFSDSDNGGYLTLKNTFSGNERVISNENASYINAVGRNIYYISEGNNGSCIVKTDLDGERKILIESDSLLTNLFASEDEMYYLEGSDAVRYDFEADEKSVIYSDSRMKAFVPQEDGICWMNGNYSDIITTHSTENSYEGTEEASVDVECCFYNPELGSNTKVNLADVLYTAGDCSDELLSLELTAKVGEKIIPTSEYPVGSYFTDNGSGCTDHRTGVCGWETESRCNCKAFHNGVPLNSVQCYGFARYIYYECFGEIGLADSETSTSIGSIPQGCITEESFKALISQTKPGAHLRVTYLKANGVTVSSHSLIILDWNDAGFSVLESNTDGKCGVSVRRIAYSDYVPTLIRVDFLMMPDIYPEVAEDETTVPDISEASTEKITAVTTTEEGTSEISSTQNETVKTTESATEESGASELYVLLLAVSEKILGFFAVIVELLVALL